MAIVVVPPVHEALSVSNFMRHDGCLCTKSVVVCGQGVSVNMDHGLASNFIPLEPGNEMVKVAHHDDLGSTHFDQYVYRGLVSEFRPVSSLSKNVLCKAVRVQSLVQLSLKLGELHLLSIVTRLIADERDCVGDRLFFWRGRRPVHLFRVIVYDASRQKNQEKKSPHTKMMRQFLPSFN